MKITKEQYHQFMHDYFYVKEYPNQRLGQVFSNKFEIADPVLFYETDDKTSISIIWDKYVDVNA